MGEKIDLDVNFRSDAAMNNVAALIQILEQLKNQMGGVEGSISKAQSATHDAAKAMSPLPDGIEQVGKASDNTAASVAAAASACEQAVRTSPDGATADLIEAIRQHHAKPMKPRPDGG